MGDIFSNFLAFSQYLDLVLPWEMGEVLQIFCLKSQFTHWIKSRYWNLMRQSIENNIFHLIKPHNYAQTRAYAWQVASFEYRRCKATPPPSMVYLEKWAKRFKYGHICLFRSVHKWAEHLNKVTAKRINTVHTDSS